MKTTPTTAYRVEYEYLTGPLDSQTPVWLSKSNDTFATHDEAIEKLNWRIREYHDHHDYLKTHFSFYTGRFQIVRVETRIDYTPVTQIDTNVEAAS